MFRKPIPLKASEHGSLVISDSDDYSFASEESLVPIVYDEMADIAREYPLVFPDNNSDLPCALVALEPGRNAYVADNGHWLATYVPAHIRRYPFLLGKAEGRENDEGDRFILMFEPDAPHFRSRSGQAVYAPDGQLSRHMLPRVALLQSIQKKTDVTRHLVRAIESAGLLVEREIVIRKEGEQNRRIMGVRVVDEKKLNQMADEDFNALRRSGALSLIYAHLLSWVNLRHGPLSGEHPQSPLKAVYEGLDLIFESDTLDLSGLD